MGSLRRPPLPLSMESMGMTRNDSGSQQLVTGPTAVSPWRGNHHLSEERWLQLVTADFK